MSSLVLLNWSFERISAGRIFAPLRSLNGNGISMMSRCFRGTFSMFFHLLDCPRFLLVSVQRVPASPRLLGGRRVQDR